MYLVFNKYGDSCQNSLNAFSNKCLLFVFVRVESFVFVSEYFAAAKASDGYTHGLKVMIKFELINFMSNKNNVYVFLLLLIVELF